VPRQRTVGYLCTGTYVLHFGYGKTNNLPYDEKYLKVKLIIPFVQVLAILREIIRDEGMFDHRNPAIILCGPALEDALNMKGLHVTEIRFIFGLFSVVYCVFPLWLQREPSHFGAAPAPELTISYPDSTSMTKFFILL